MLVKFVKCFVFICSLLLPNSEAFWWSATTTTEAPTVFKQMPLTYFRTYTYQPLAGNPYAFPFFAPPPAQAALQQAPILAGARYDHYAGHYPAVLPLPETLQLLKAPSLPTTTTSTTSAPTQPTTTPTTTTTTTTTTPTPTTSASTTTSTTTTTAINRNSVEPLINPAAAFSAYPSATYSNSEFPTYNRRLFSTGYGSNNYRPHYPYPEYYTYNNAGLKNGSPFSTGSRGSQLQFVPCLCPVNMGGSGTASGSASALGPLSFGDQGNNAFYTQSRASADDEKDMELPTETMDSTKAKIIIESEADSKAQITSEELKDPHNSLTNKIDDEVLQATSSEESFEHTKEI